MLEDLIRKIAREEFIKLIGTAGVEVLETKDVAAVRTAVIEHDIRTEVTSILHDLGIRPHLLGYQYMREAIEMVCADVSVLKNITKTLYPEIAVRFGTMPSRVERAIRHSIETAWHRKENDAMSRLFGVITTSNKPKPTNSEFIAMIADHVIIGGRTSCIS